MSNEKDQNKTDKDNVIISTELYDGIIEHDHPLPNWWISIFILTIIFSVFYYGYYELFDGPSTDQELAAKMELIQSSVAETSGGGDFSDLDERIKDLSLIPLGQEVYAGKCFMCHGDKGQGLIGPNLADNFWIHGNSPADILYVIQKGVPEKGMVPWESVLSAEEQVATVAFILSLKGTNPAGGKPPEGEEYKD